MSSIPEFDTTKYRLGKLCPRQHDYFNTGQSLRRRDNNSCIACGKIVKAAYNAKNKDKVSKAFKRWYDENRESVLVRKKRYNEENRESILAKKKEYRETHKEQIAVYMEQWRAENQDKILAQRQAWYAVNGDYAREQSNRRYHANREQHAKLLRKWHVNNPQRSKQLRINYRARKARAEGTHTPEQSALVREKQGNKCLYCGCDLDATANLDHFVPLKHGGRNSIENLAWACKPCNVSKHARLPWNWPKWNGATPVFWDGRLL